MNGLGYPRKNEISWNTQIQRGLALKSSRDVLKVAFCCCWRHNLHTKTDWVQETRDETTAKNNARPIRAQCRPGYKTKCLTFEKNGNGENFRLTFQSERKLASFSSTRLFTSFEILCGYRSYSDPRLIYHLYLAQCTMHRLSIKVPLYTNIARGTTDPWVDTITGGTL